MPKRGRNGGQNEVETNVRQDAPPTEFSNFVAAAAAGAQPSVSSRRVRCSSRSCRAAEALAMAAVATEIVKTDL